MSQMKKHLRQFLLLIFLSSILIASIGCNTQPDQYNDVSVDPFSTEYTIGDDREILLEGNTAGHLSGKISEFTIALKNNSADSIWQNQFCVLLVDENSVVLNISHEDFSIDPNAQVMYTVDTEFGDLLKGAYGLVILIPGQARIIQAIWLGEKNNADVENWFEVRSCN